MARDKDGAIVTTTTNSKDSPKGLLQVLSEIEQYSVAEKEGSSIPEEVLTTEKIRTYWIEGARFSAFSVVATLFLSPFMFAAHEGIIPVFGSYSPSPFEKVFIILLTVSASLVTSFFNFLTPDHILLMLWRLPEFLRPGYNSYLWMSKFAEQLIPSVYFLTIVNFFSILILALSVVLGKMKTRRIDKYRKICRGFKKALQNPLMSFFIRG